MAQSRISSESRSKLSVERLELLMRLSLLHRQRGFDLADKSPEDILGESATIFDQELGRIRCNQTIICYPCWGVNILQMENMLKIEKYRPHTKQPGLVVQEISERTRSTIEVHPKFF